MQQAKDMSRITSDLRGRFRRDFTSATELLKSHKEALLRYYALSALGHLSAPANCIFSSEQERNSIEARLVLGSITKRWSVLIVESIPGTSAQLIVRLKNIIALHMGRTLADLVQLYAENNMVYTHDCDHIFDRNILGQFERATSYYLLGIIASDGIHCVRLQKLGLYQGWHQVKFMVHLAVSCLETYWYYISNYSQDYVATATALITHDIKVYTIADIPTHIARIPVQMQHRILEIINTGTFVALERAEAEMQDAEAGQPLDMCL